MLNRSPKALEITSSLLNVCFGPVFSIFTPDLVKTSEACISVSLSQLTVGLMAEKGFCDT